MVGLRSDWYKITEGNLCKRALKVLSLMKKRLRITQTPEFLLEVAKVPETSLSKFKSLKLFSLIILIDRLSYYMNVNI